MKEVTLTTSELGIIVAAAGAVATMVGGVGASLVAARFTRNHAVVLETLRERRDLADEVGLSYLALRDALSHALSRVDRAHAVVQITTASPEEVGAAHRRLNQACDRWVMADKYGAGFVQEVQIGCTTAVGKAHDYLHDPTEERHAEAKSAASSLSGFEARVEAFTREQRREKRRRWWRVALRA